METFFAVFREANIEGNSHFFYCASYITCQRIPACSSSNQCLFYFPAEAHVSQGLSASRSPLHE